MSAAHAHAHEDEAPLGNVSELWIRAYACPTCARRVRWASGWVEVANAGRMTCLAKEHEAGVFDVGVAAGRRRGYALRIVVEGGKAVVFRVEAPLRGHPVAVLGVAASADVVLTAAQAVAMATAVVDALRLGVDQVTFGGASHQEPCRSETESAPPASTPRARSRAPRWSTTALVAQRPAVKADPSAPARLPRAGLGLSRH